MVAATSAAHFWAAVEDCLVTFHQFRRCEAADKVTSLWRRLPAAVEDSNPAFSDMIYHAEPWQIACNLADREMAIGQRKKQYQALLIWNGLLAR